MNKNFRKKMSIVLLIFMILTFFSCRKSEKMVFDYDDVTVNDELVLDLSTANLEGLSLWMSIDDVMKSEIFSEGALKMYHAGELEAKKYDGSPTRWPDEDAIFYDENYGDITLCGENADMYMNFDNDMLQYLNVTSQINILEEGIDPENWKELYNQKTREVQSELYRILGEPNYVEYNTVQNMLTWRYFIINGKPIEEKIDLGKSDKKDYKIYTEMDYDYMIVYMVSEPNITDVSSLYSDPVIGTNLVALLTKERVVSNMPRP